MLMNKRRTQRKVTKPLTHLQKLNLKRGAIMFCFGGLISGCSNWVVRNFLRPQLQRHMGDISHKLRLIRDDAVDDVEREIEAEKKRINDAMKEILNEPDAGN